MLTEIARKTILAAGRSLAKLADLDNLTRAGGYDGGARPKLMSADDPDANLVASVMGDGRHLPALDIDFPCYTIPSSTPGHAHLYFDKPLKWNDYKKLLRTLNEIGYIEDGFYKSAVYDGTTFLRLPGVTKPRKSA